MPLRAAPLFAATVNATEPLPLPLVPLAIVIHDTFEDAVHAHPLLLVTVTVPLPPVASTDWVVGEIEYVHCGGGGGGGGAAA